MAPNEKGFAAVRPVKLVGRRLDVAGLLSSEEAAEVRRRLADPDDKAIPFDQACREFGI